MSSVVITPVILCGGSGTRLWPLSRKSFPKQFVPLVGDQSLLELTLRRVAPLGEQVLMVAADEHRFMVLEALDAAGVSGAMLLEPAARNTAAAMALAALYLRAGASLMRSCCSVRRIITSRMPRHLRPRWLMG